MIKSLLLLGCVILVVFIYSFFFVSYQNKIPINFFPLSMKPAIKVRIQEKEYTCLLDLGCGYPMILHDRIIDQISKKEKVADTIIGDVKGNRYPSSVFVIPEVKICEHGFHDLNVIQDVEAFYANVQMVPSTNKKMRQFDGKIGWAALQDYDCLIDFPNSVICLEKKGTAKNFSNQFIAVPFTLEKSGITIKIETDAGARKMSLDTGASFSIMNQELMSQVLAKEVEKGKGDWYFPSKKLTIEKTDFGPWEFAFFQIASEWGIDGCLGADFFLEHAVFLDFQNGIAYIEKPHKFFILTQWKRFKHKVTQCYRRWFYA